MNMANDIINDIAQQPWPPTSTYTPLGVHLLFGQSARTIPPKGLQPPIETPLGR
jgi:hypothetical protein